MNKILLLIVLVFSVSLMRAQEANWLSSIEVAKAQAAEENKAILISFSGSDWCLPCAKLERDLFKNATFIEFADEHLVLVKADFPARKKNQLSEDQKKHNEQLAEQFNPQGTFPKVALISSKGELIGYMQHPKNDATAYIKSIQNLIGEK